MPSSVRCLASASLAAVLAAAALACGGRTDASGRAGGVAVEVDRARVVATSRLRIGVTHTQHSLDPWGVPAAVRRGRRLVHEVGEVQNQHIYGWGGLNPEPRPGEFAWASLDRRVALMRATGATPVITLCCAPDWMTRLGTMTSTYPNLPPTPEHVDDFAALAARIARRYPDVHHFMVWNEMKGFYDLRLGRWDVQAYTRLYNAVHAALKAVDPDIAVGGPYLVLEGTGSRRLGRSGGATRMPLTPRDRFVLDYWLRNARGADFVVVDRNVHPVHDPNRYSHAEYLELTSRFAHVAREVRAITHLPVWFAEDYFRDDPDRRYVAAGLASMLAGELVGGASVSLRWSPQDDGGGAGDAQSLFSDTRRADGGRPYPAFAVYRAFARDFAPGTRIVRTRSSSPSRVGVLASRTATLLVNRRPDPVAVSLDGTRLRLGRYEVRIVRRRP